MLPIWLLRWFYGFDLDQPATTFSDKDGYGVFSALAGFAVAQAAALTAVARGENHTELVIGIYILTVVVTLFWTIAMLRAKRDNPAGSMLRAFDRASIRYGRWVISWTVVLAAVLIYLGINGLLPNQTTRVQISPLEIANTASSFNEFQKKTPSSSRAMNRWVEWAASTSMTTTGEVFFWIEQESPFKESYKPFNLDVICLKDYTFGQRVAFLLRREPGENAATYRQVQIDDPTTQTNKITLQVADATKGEKVIVLAFARSGKKELRLTNGNQLDVHFVPRAAD